MASDEIRLHGVTVARTEVTAPRRTGKRLTVAVRAKIDHVGIMHAGARGADRR